MRLRLPAVGAALAPPTDVYALGRQPPEARVQQSPDPAMCYDLMPANTMQSAPKQKGIAIHNSKLAAADKLPPKSHNIYAKACERTHARQSKHAQIGCCRARTAATHLCAGQGDV